MARTQQLERVMRKSLIGMSVALAAVSMTVTSAEAKGKGFRIGVGVGLLLGGAILHHHHRHQARPVIVHRPVTVQRQQQPVAALPALRSADDLGRTYDVASRTWFDGRDRCWTGQQAWTFRGGSWFYGQAAWYESNGQWLTNAADTPAQVDCAKVPVFAARMPKGADKSAGVVVPSSIDQGAAPTDVVRTPDGQRVSAQSDDNGNASGGTPAVLR